ncbi:MAG TPA: hypothetical protein VNH46_02425, partial [Gemmatimonadales bacterium]|nr:hypothetical protein [Gemmatimonadales bacterium]
RLTETGLAVGTPAYMSPEQSAAERQLDGRSDQYSLACVTYEMLLGHAPFTGGTAREVIARHATDPVPPLRTVRETIPPQVEHAIGRALAKTPADRYPTAKHFAAALTALEEPRVASLPVPSARPRHRSLWMLAATVLVLAAATAMAVLLRSHSAGQPPTVVVLRPQHVPAPEDEWFADGMAGEISNRLTQISGLRVIATQTAARFASSDLGLPEFAHRIGAAYVVALDLGYDRPGGGLRRVRVGAQLISARSGEAVWGETYTDTLSGQVFDLQTAIAEHVAQALDVTVLAPEREALHQRPTESVEAYDAYLRGNRAAPGGYLDSFGASDRQAAVKEYLTAVTIDDRFAEAHARLAIQYALLARTAADLAASRQHADRALALQPGLALAHLARAIWAYKVDDRHRVMAEAAEAERLAPNSAEILEATATLYWRYNENALMARNYERAFALDPLSWGVALDLGVAYFGLHRNAEAERQIDRAIALDSTQPDAYMYKAWLYLSWKGSVPAASEVLQTSVRRLGPRRGFAQPFLSSYWWVSRLMARDPWYRDMLERVSLERGEIDSVPYYAHRAAMAEGLGQRERSRALWDSVAGVVRGRLQQDVPPERASILHSELAVALAALGDSQGALAEADRSDGDLTHAMAYAELGDGEHAAVYFERLMREANWLTPTFLALDPTFEPLRSNPRFARLLAGG